MALFQRYCGHGITLDKECLACAALYRMDQHRDADRKELRNLRLSVQRVGEIAHTLGAVVNIPPEGNERGWNNLCGELVDYLLSLRPEGERDKLTSEYPELIGYSDVPD